VLARRIALLLHPVDPLPSAVPGFGLIGDSPATVRLRPGIRSAAGLDVPVLLRGATGTGKELVARALHDACKHRQGPYVTVNLAGLSPSLAASELFESGLRFVQPARHKSSLTYEGYDDVSRFGERFGLLVGDSSRLSQ
jgi:transcriptional regulator with AAA-type ATPase domain